MECLEQVGRRDCGGVSEAAREERRVRKKRTSRGPEALGGLDEQVLEETGVAVTEELRADEGEDGETGVQSVVVVHCHRSSINGRHKHPRNVLTVLDGDDLNGSRGHGCR